MKIGTEEKTPMRELARLFGITQQNIIAVKVIALEDGECQITCSSRLPGMEKPMKFYRSIRALNRSDHRGS